jgi:hypothetical protein
MIDNLDFKVRCFSLIVEAQPFMDNGLERWSVVAAPWYASPGSNLTANHQPSSPPWNLYTVSYMTIRER